ncbi:MAG: class I SAM-dependent RNA methyltransferase, partial [Lachnospiraceae bacterium]|nr:class I SAM-dependent RNA methyltransferase [Lachnospiraceae bacterium]
MKKGEIVSGKVIRVDYPNKGILLAMDEAEGQEREVVVKNALPGQTVEARIIKKRHGRPEGQLLEVLAPAPNEKTVADGLCPHFGLCGGCCYRSMPYEEELAMKEGQIRRLLDSAIDTPYEFEPITHGPLSSEFRNKMEFSFGDEYKDGPLALGLHKRNSMYDIVPVTECQMIDEGMRQILDATLRFYREKGLPYYHKMRHDGVLRHLLLRKSFSDGGYMVALVTTGETAALDLPSYVETLRALPAGAQIRGILHMVNDSVADTVASQKTTVLYGTEFLTENLLGLTFNISPFSFFQTNTLGAEVLYRVARSYVGETQGRTIFDLYSGTGTIAQMLAPVARHVVGVEIVEEAVEAARENAVRNHLDNCTFIAGDVLKKLDEIEERPD